MPEQDRAATRERAAGARGVAAGNRVVWRAGATRERRFGPEWVGAADAAADIGPVFGPIRPGFRHRLPARTADRALRLGFTRFLAGIRLSCYRPLRKIYSQELLDVLFEQPYCRIGNVVDAGVVQRQAASRYLKALAQVGILSERKVGREKLFVHSRLLELLMSEQHTYAPLAVTSTDL